MSARAPSRGTRFPAALDQRTADAAQRTARGPLRPQRLLHEAAQDASRRVVPTGIGLDSASVRQRMVERLRAERLCSEAVLEAMTRIERHRFLDSALVAQAYEDTSLPIGHGQTISKPSVVARMLGLLCEGRSARGSGHLGRVLEVGTGCGYQAALLRLLAPEVWSIERVLALHERARHNLEHLGLDRLMLVHGDGTDGLSGGVPYQSIVSAAGGDAVPSAWLAQLAPGGRLVAPVRPSASDQQVLLVVDKAADGTLHRFAVDGVRFVPLESGTV